jgi:hypothetical protein
MVSLGVDDGEVYLRPHGGDTQEHIKGSREMPLETLNWSGGATSSLASGDRLAIIGGLTNFQKRSQPSQHSRPTPVTLSHFGMRSETAVANPDESALSCGFQLPPDGSLHITRPARNPRIGQQPRWINFQILACDDEPAAIRPQASAAPFPSIAQVGIKVRAAINPTLAPPFHHLCGINQGLEHAVRWRSNVDLADDFIGIGRDF